jgi:hypothetical protein
MKDHFLPLFYSPNNQIRNAETPRHRQVESGSPRFHHIQADAAPSILAEPVATDSARTSDPGLAGC